MTRTDRISIGTCVRAFAFGAAMVLCKSAAATMIIGGLFAADVVGGMWLQYKRTQKKKALNRRQPVKSKGNITYIFSIHDKAGVRQDDISI